MSVQTLMAEADKLLERNKFPEAITKLKQALTSEPLNHLVATRMANAFIAQNEKLKASQVYWGLAKRLTDAEKNQVAIAFYKQAIELDPQNLELRMQYAYECESVGKQGEALQNSQVLLRFFLARKKYFDAANIMPLIARLSPQDANFKMAWIDILQLSLAEHKLLNLLVSVTGPPGLVSKDIPQGGDPIKLSPQAFQALKGLCNWFPKDPKVPYSVAWVAYKQNNIQEACANLFETFRRDPSFTLGYLLFARILSDLKKLNEAMFVFKIARGAIGSDNHVDKATLVKLIDQFVQENGWIAFAEGTGEDGISAVEFVNSITGKVTEAKVTEKEPEKKEEEMKSAAPAEISLSPGDIALPLQTEEFEIEFSGGKTKIIDGNLLEKVENVKNANVEIEAVEEKIKAPVEAEPESGKDSEKEISPPAMSFEQLVDQEKQERPKEVKVKILEEPLIITAPPALTLEAEPLASISPLETESIAEELSFSAGSDDRTVIVPMKSTMPEEAPLPAKTEVKPVDEQPLDPIALFFKDNKKEKSKVTQKQAPPPKTEVSQAMQQLPAPELTKAPEKPLDPPVQEKTASAAQEEKSLSPLELLEAAKQSRFQRASTVSSANTSTNSTVGSKPIVPLPVEENIPEPVAEFENPLPPEEAPPAPFVPMVNFSMPNMPPRSDKYIFEMDEEPSPDPAAGSEEDGKTAIVSTEKLKTELNATVNTSPTPISSQTENEDGKTVVNQQPMDLIGEKTELGEELGLEQMRPSASIAGSDAENGEVFVDDGTIDLGDDLIEGPTRHIDKEYTPDRTVHLIKELREDLAASNPSSTQDDAKLLLRKAERYIAKRNYYLARKALKHAQALGANEELVKEKLREVRKLELPDALYHQTSSDTEQSKASTLLEELEREFSFDKTVGEEELKAIRKGVDSKIEEVASDEDYQTSLDFGVALYEMGFFLEAESLLNAVINRHPQIAYNAFYLMAVCKLARNDYAGAASILDRLGASADKSEMEKIDVYYKLAEVFKKMGQNNKSQSYFEKVAKIDANYRMVREKIEK